MLSSLLQHPGVLSAFVTDDAGHLITAAGESMPPSAGVLVLAHATLSAASEFGRRSGSGDCIELVQHHEGGLVLLRGLPHRHALIVRCEAEANMDSVRSHAATFQLSTTGSTQPRRASTPALNLGDALHAMPAW